MSKHLGDFDTSTVIYGKFTTFRPSTGAAFTLGGTPALSVYKTNSTTQSTTGVTLTVDFDSVTGLHHFAIDTSADGTFYSAGGMFDIVITTGTVDSVSVVGAVVGSFTLRATSALKPTTAGRTLDVSAGGEAGIDWANVGSPTTTVNLSGTTVKTATDVETDTADIQTRIPAALTAGGNMKADALALSGDTVAADNAEAFFDGTGYAGTNNVIPTVTTLTGHTPQTGDSYAIVNSGAHGNAALKTLIDAVDNFVDTEVTLILTKLQGIILANGTIGSTGNDTTHLHLTGLTYGNDEINSYLLVIFDVSEGEYHARWIEDWADTGDLATVSTLPFTPQNATDTYWLLPIRSDVTGGSGLDAAGVRAAIGLASANLDTQLDALPTNSELSTALAAADDAVLAAIAALNNLSQANIRTAVGLASANLDTQLSVIKSNGDLADGWTWVGGPLIGTPGGNGTIREPTETWAEAKALADASGRKRIKVMESITLSATVAANNLQIDDGDFSNYCIDFNHSGWMYPNSQQPTKSTFLNFRLRALTTMGETSVLFNDPTGGLRFIDGSFASDVTWASTASDFIRVKFSGGMTLGNVTHTLRLIDCACVNSTGIFPLDCAGRQGAFTFFRWVGDIDLTNATHASLTMRFYGQGTLKIYNSCTAGTIYVSGMRVTDEAGALWVNGSGKPTVTMVEDVTQIWTTALTEAYRATGATGTAAQLLYEILQNITEFSISSTTKTTKKLDGSTTAKTYTLNDATNPTAITEAT